jgi:non-ribosomal peptide synthetase component F
LFFFFFVLLCCVTHTVSLSLCLYLSLSLYVSLSLSLCLFLPQSMSVCMSVCLPLTHSLTHSLHLHPLLFTSPNHNHHDYTHHQQIAVVTFTSGSTGLPKGVLGRHRSLTHMYPWMMNEFNLSDTDHFSMCSGISHDPLQRDIFTPLYMGATLHIPDHEDIANPGQLATWFRAHAITVTHLTPAMGQLLASSVTNDSTKEEMEEARLECLRFALFVGDKLTKRDVYRLRRLAPAVQALNCFGSTYAASLACGGGGCSVYP